MTARSFSVELTLALSDGYPVLAEELQKDRAHYENKNSRVNSLCPSRSSSEQS